jgi:hypothetical protein
MRSSIEPATVRTVAYTHLFTGADGRSHFQDRLIRLPVDEHGSWSSAMFSSEVMVRLVPKGWSSGFHVAPRRQFVINLRGTLEIVCSDGAIRLFGHRDILLADDRTGEGHKSSNLSGDRLILIISGDDVNLEALGCAMALGANPGAHEQAALALSSRPLCRCEAPLGRCEEQTGAR